MAEAASDAGLGPPSYEQAITTGGQGWWLELVAPYVSVGDYPSLCLVSRRFYDVFCPRLWKDPLVTVRILGLDPGNDFAWYLDVSGLPGSVRPLVKAADRFPRLRVLKARRRELVAADASNLVKAFAGRLWSLDLSDNPLSDAVLLALNQFMTASSSSLRTDGHFAAEGMLDWPRCEGSDAYGPFYHIKESGFSDTFSHANRYLADPPTYPPGEFHDGNHRPSPVRANGRTPIKNDSIEFLKQALLGDDAPVDAACATLSAARMSPVVLSHLHLSNTKVTALGVERLVRESSGQLESLDCESARLNINIPRHSPWPKSTRLYGLLGSPHIWRPVLSSNLRELRVHHSVVTQIPTMEAEGMSSLRRLWLAETSIRRRCEMAYPLAFVPDTNPRVTSLTLTRIPRRSSGPLIGKIIGFLKAASIQERAIADATISSSRRAPMMLRGLRNVRLEFEADPMDDPGRFATSADLDEDGILDLSLDAVTFSTTTSASRSNGHPGSDRAEQSPWLSTHPGAAIADFTRSREEYVSHTLQWRGTTFEARVWVGSGMPSSNPATNAYQQLVRSGYRQVVGAASPAHVKAGVPAGSLIYLDAWDAMILPERVEGARQEVLAGMKDVLTELKRYRVSTREAYEREKRKCAGLSGQVGLGAPHYFFTGKVEVIVKDSSTHYHASEYWR
ncbi:hypothetical protein SAPIO_CDS0886 [Scedosporium apiospermum]|uniref:Uncharacterized protein n=1 Tax=Pseudallescheria apiosperma TaxID=563466 RepID=A0A084GFD0_PSEDA|nr:uncharacterized protein SAPIO_CDS0886 [Scedosporium apiospermum]KEZ46042.1 hypothetical protein SAPIO_CDS0886 [Scedosporium apiospermum]